MKKPDKDPDKKSERLVLKKTIMKASQLGIRLLRNNRGQFYTMGPIQKLIGCVRGNNLMAARDAMTKLAQVRAGLEAPGASDTVGMVTVTITEEWLGCTVGIPLVVECKESSWTRPTDRTEKDQENFIEQVEKRGGIGFFCNDWEKLDAKIKEGLNRIKKSRVVPENSITELSASKFNEWMSERWNEYSRAGLDDQNSPNYDPSKAIEEFIKDFSEAYPNGLKIKSAKR